MSKSIKSAIVVIALGLSGLAMALATTSDAFAEVQPSAEQPAPPPSASLANPADDPVEAYSDLKAAKKQGWAFAVIAAVCMLAAGIGRAAVKWPSAPVLSWINQHKKVLIVSAIVSASAAAAFDALALGGSWFSVLWAAAGAAMVAINAAPSEAKWVDPDLGKASCSEHGGNCDAAKAPLAK